jgi:hypothetical protein
VYRPRAWSAIHTRHRLEALEEQLRDRQIRVGIVCVAAPGDSRDVAAAAQTITTGLPWVTDDGIVAHDPATVVIYEGGEVFRPERSLLARSGHTLARRLYADLAPVAAAPGVDAVEDVRRATRRGRRRAS